MKFRGKFIQITAFIIMLFFVFICFAPLFVRADSLSDKKQNAKNQIGTFEAQNKKILDEKKAADEKIAGLQSTLDGIQAEIDKHTAEIDKLQSELDEAEKALDDRYETFKVRMRVMYEQGSVGMLDVLLSSADIMDFLNKYEIVKQIAEYDSNMLQKLSDAKTTIEETKIKIEDERKAQQTKFDKYNSQKKTLNAEQKKRDSMINENNMEIKKLEKLLAEIAAEEQRLLREATSLQSKNTKYTGGELLWPAPGYYTITCPFGPRIHPITKKNSNHQGVDIAVPSGVPILAANSGTVIVAGYNYVYGNYVRIDHGGGIATLYAHASSLSVSVGQKVTKGQEIMRCGSTGYSTGPHLHFEISKSGTAINPMSYF